MEQVTLFRLSGAASIIAGAVRILNTFTTHLPSTRTLDLLYLLTDILLLLGLIGWYVSRASKLGASGAIGFVISIAGILIIRSAGLFPGYGYLTGAMALLAGLVVMNAPTLLRWNDAILPPILWLLSLVCAVSSFALAFLGIISATLFGAGFICAGFHLLRRSA